MTVQEHFEQNLQNVLEYCQHILPEQLQRGLIPFGRKLPPGQRTQTVRT